MKKLILLLTLISSSASARGYEAYSPSTGQTTYIQESGYAPARMARINIDDGYSGYQAPMRVSNLAPSLGDLGHSAYSEPFDYEE